jgi:soluble lytic murein transglycosylase-like protein
MDRVLCVAFCLLVIAVALCALAYCCEPTVEAVVAETTQENTEHTEETTIVTEPPTTAETEPPLVLYDVPLDVELQLHIIEQAEEHGIDPAIIFAMAFRESTYNPKCIGDGGNSYGLLQVQPKWHKKRMEKLGCTDLLDPYQNVIVGIDHLCELLSRYGNIAKALTAYNKGSYNGTVTQYAKNVLATANQLNNERSH